MPHVATEGYGYGMSENPPHTPPRQMRIPDDEWLPFNAAAKAQGQTRAGVVRDLIRWYLRRPGARLPVRPESGPWSAPATGQDDAPAGS